MDVIDSYLHWLGRHVAGSPLSQSHPLHALAALPLSLSLRLSGRPPLPRLHLFEGDDLLGWKLRPEADSAHSYFDIRVRYRTDAERRRRIPFQGSGQAVYLLGCSFTFGFCVNDDQSFAALLGREYRITNWAVPGYGTAHQHLLLSQGGVIERAAEEGATIVYVWDPVHLSRLWRRRSHLAPLEAIASYAGGYRGSPLHELEEGRLVHRGLARIQDAVDDTAPLVSEMEWRLTDELLRAMRDGAARAGVRLLVALLPAFNPPSAKRLEQISRMRARLSALAIDTIDMHAPRQEDEPRAIFPFMGYYTPLGHAILAERLAAGLREKLGRPSRA